MGFWQILLLVLIGFVGLLFLRFFLEVYISYKTRKEARKQKYTVVSVRVSRENEIGPIVAEQIFATMHGIYQKLSFWDRLRGKVQDQISFEIASVSRSIRFYIAFPTHLRNLVEGQIYAQYPDVEIEDVEDYAGSKAMSIAFGSDGSGVSAGSSSGLNGQDKKEMVPLSNLPAMGEERKFGDVDIYANAMAAELKLYAPDIYPIKRYPQFEDRMQRVSIDPLAGVTATLSKLNRPEDQAWIQFNVRPLPDKWRVVFRRCIRILSKGMFANIERFTSMYARWYCNRNPVVRMALFPLYFIFWLQGFRVEKGKTKLDVALAAAKGQEVVEEEGHDVAESLSRASHEGESGSEAAIDKVVKFMFDVSARIVYVPTVKDDQGAKLKLREIAGSFKQFNLSHLNGFEISEYIEGSEAVKRYNRREIIDPFVLNAEELATVYHLPNMTVTTPNIYWVRSKKLEPPLDIPTTKDVAEEDLTVLGKTNFRGSNQTFGIKTLDRRRHMYIIGKTGMGKSTLLENMIFSDIQAGRGVAVIDPHGDLADAVLNFVPSSRTNDVVIFNPADRDHPVAFNMLENIDPAFNTIVCSGLVGIFKKIYAHSWGPRLEHILRNTILSLLEYPNTTMLGITRMLQDKDFRRKVVRKISDPIVKAFWEQEFETMQDRQKIEAISPILNKVGQFLSSPIVRNIVGQPKSAVDLRFMMDKKKIIVVNLSKGMIGEDISSLLGSMMITKFQLDAMSRANIPEKDRVDFYLYVDEFQNFATDSFATILSEARKYRLNLTMANQYIAQMPEEVRDAVFGNVGSILSFQVGYDDADYLSQQYSEEVSANDLVSLNKYTSYMRLLVDGMPTKTFSLDTLAPPELEHEDGRVEKILKVSRERYSKPREGVEDKIRRWSIPDSEKRALKEGGEDDGNKETKGKKSNGGKK